MERNINLAKKKTINSPRRTTFLSYLPGIRRSLCSLSASPGWHPTPGQNLTGPPSGGRDPPAPATPPPPTVAAPAPAAAARKPFLPGETLLFLRHGLVGPPPPRGHGTNFKGSGEKPSSSSRTYESTLFSLLSSCQNSALLLLLQFLWTFLDSFRSHTTDSTASAFPTQPPPPPPKKKPQQLERAPGRAQSARASAPQTRGLSGGRKVPQTQPKLRPKMPALVLNESVCLNI